MRKEPTEHAPSLWLGAALVFFVLAILAAAFGSLFTTQWILNEQVHPRLHSLGLILLIAAIPIVILAAHCLDLRDRHESGHSKKTQQYFTRGLSIVFAVLIYGAASLVHGQQTIFNVPTTDVLDKAKVYVELDASLKPTGGQFGFEQALNKKVTFAADWFTGKHSSGYFTPGVVFKPGPKVTGYAGYSIGNEDVSNGNHFFLLEVGYNFN